MKRLNLLSERLNWAIKQRLEGEPSLKRITQNKLASVAGVSPSAAGYWFANKNGIDATQARRIGAFLGVSPTWLETGEGDPFPDKQESPGNDFVRASEIEALVIVFCRATQSGKKGIIAAAETAAKEINLPFPFVKNG